MREIVVLSGKGGTGKTSVALSFAALADAVIIADCDVDAPDLAIVLDPQVEQTSPFLGGDLATVDPLRCDGCGACEAHCRFHAIKVGPDEVARVDEIACEGCGVCEVVCPAKAIRLRPVVTGHHYRSGTRHGTLIHADLGAGRDNSGKLVARVRDEARQAASREGAELVLSDGPPGIGCAAIAALSGAELALVVTEPSVSSLHDFERLAELIRHFGVEAVLCVNKHDVNRDLTTQLETRATELGIEPVGRIPYDRAVTDAQQARRCVVEFSDNGAAHAIREVWTRVRSRLDGNLKTKKE